MSEIQKKKEKKKKDQIHSIFVCGPKKLKDSDQPEHAGGEAWNSQGRLVYDSLAWNWMKVHKIPTCPKMD